MRLNNSYTTKGPAKNITQAMMAEIVECNQSTISRELSANPHKYSAQKAHARALKRRQHCKDLVAVWSDDQSLRSEIEQKLIHGWSPAQIRGRRRLEGKKYVSVPTIYAHIAQDKKRGGTLYRALRYQGKKHKWWGFGASRELIPDRVDISLRPQEVELKTSFGHWESDLVVGPQSTKDVVATFVERKSMYFQAFKSTRNSSDMVSATKKALGNLPEPLRQTMTHDNGLEISKHTQITKDLGVKVYCANPYSSWERGLNEWCNRELRRFFPKGTDFRNITQEQIDFAVAWLNNCPRKTLGYRTPREVFEKQDLIMQSVV